MEAIKPWTGRTTASNHKDDVDGSVMIQTRRGERGEGSHPWISNFREDVICFSSPTFGERSEIQAPAAADRHGHTGNVMFSSTQTPC